jgi:general secretion pathway protein D
MHPSTSSGRTDFKYHRAEAINSQYKVGTVNISFLNKCYGKLGKTSMNQIITFNLKKAVEYGIKRRKPSSPALPPEGEGSNSLSFWERARVRVKPYVARLRWQCAISTAFSRLKESRLSMDKCVQVLALVAALSSLLPLQLNAAEEVLVNPLSEPALGIAENERLIDSTSTQTSGQTSSKPSAQTKASRNKNTVAKATPTKKTTPAGEDAIIGKLEFKQANMVDVVRALADMSGLNIVATDEAAKKTVTVFLQNISVKDALDTISKNSGLWYRQDKVSKTYRIMSTDEYQRDMVVYREDTTRIFNLLHPNPIEVATVIRDVYGSRVIVSQLCDSGAVRKLGGATNAGTGANGSVRATNRNNASTSQNNRQQNSNSRNNGGDLNGQSERRVNDQMTADQLQQVDELVVTSNGNTITAEQLSRIGSSEPSIYLSVNCEHNLIILRTSDNVAIKDIEYLIKEMDRPVPQVLLEMKILELSTGDSFEQLFDMNYQVGAVKKGPGVWLPGDPPLPPVPALTVKPGDASPFNAGYLGTLAKQHNLTTGAGSLVYQFLSDNISAKIKLLETQSRVKTISSPVLLASNNRTSVLFVGTENLITKGWNPGSVTTPANGAPTVVAPYPNLIAQDVGPKLTITPKINADQTVTLEIDEAVTSIVRNLSQVYVADAFGNVTPQFVDGLSKATINGIVTAKDGLTVAIGGLIKTSESKADSKVPILGNIPLLGELFKSKNDKNGRTEMILLITPHIITNPAQTDDATRDVVEPLSEQEW